jgi:hypothetical protein
MKNRNQLGRIGTGTKLHHTDGERAYCNYDGWTRKTRAMKVDLKHATENNLCRKCFPNGVDSLQHMLAHQAKMEQ